jgi:hypothetical protein
VENDLKLEPNSSQPGLLVNPSWSEGQPGTFAVIVGVSRYLHLDGGSAPAPETYGLGQLAVSALTAREVFRWLEEDFYLEDALPAKCWLLLAPTSQETSYDAQVGVNAADPTFDNLRKAIGSWWAAMRALPADAAAKSRALFFFSGHGLEIHQQQHVLLPSDYLGPPARAWNDAVSTANLRNGLASLGVPYQFFFVDACRNGHADLRRKIIPGSLILNEDDVQDTNPSVVSPILYATAPGQQAYQQPDPGKGFSIFGTALLEGLRGEPDIKLVPHDPFAAVNLMALQGFVKQRVVRLLAEANALVTQPVKLGGSVEDLTVTLLKPETLRASRGPVAGGFGRKLHEPPPATPSMAQRVERIERALDRTFDVSHDVTQDLRAELLRGNFDAAHDLFGSEEVTPTWMFDRLKLYALGANAWIPAQSIVLHNVSHRKDTRSYRVELTIEASDAVGFWLQLMDASGTAWACVLPVESGRSPRWVLEFDVAYNQGSGRQITRLDVALSTGNQGALGFAAELWHRYQNGDAQEAARFFLESGSVVRPIFKELDSPLTALVAALVLLQANRLDIVRDFLWAVGDRFPLLPDARILWAEQLLRSGRRQAAKEAAGELAKVAQGRVPFFSEALGYASSVTDALIRMLPSESQPHLKTFRTRIDHALVSFRPGGLSAVYAEFHGDPPSIVGPSSA